ncbi:MAG: helicase-related protein [Candidatus Binataceae bacterium]
MEGEQNPIRLGEVISGSLFSEPMRVVTVNAVGTDNWELGLVGIQTRLFRSVPLTREQIASLRRQDVSASYSGNGELVRLGLQAYALGIAYEFDPYFGLSISRVDPLPHQLEAVYDYLLKLARVRFLLADDAGAGKTIMAGLLLRELKLRGLADRVLIVCPANLTFQWQRELKEKFDEKFVVLRGGDIREQYGINQWLENRQVITSLDLAKRESIVAGLRQVRWDVVIVDEAHRMSWTPPARKTARYALGEMLRDSSDHILLLTATPHKGDPENFSRFLQLLDPDAYADVKSIREAMRHRSAPFYLRRTKEAMLYFPERQSDGSWKARKLFTERDTRTAAFTIDDEEYDLYRTVTSFVKEQSAKAAARGDDPRARAVGFLMALYQRRLASSAYALRHSLENRARRLIENLKRARDLASTAPPDLPDPEDLEEMEEAERDHFERLLEAISIAQSPAQVREEVERLNQLAERAKALEEAGVEAKLAKLRAVLREQGFFDNPDERLLIFTEFRDTLDYLVENLRKWAFRVGFIHGGMAIGSRDDKGTRLFTEQQFRDGAIQILVATEAAGEGINLQCCHVLFNHDIPWNPNRLEQRMGRIHRYGQTENCLIFNFVATNTVEGRILDRLHERLAEIRDALDDDAVFNVVGEVLPAAHIERVLRDYYAGRMGDADLEDRLLSVVSEDRFRAICQNALEGLATKRLNLTMLIERRARAQERRVVPETIARFLAQSAPYVPFALKAAASIPHAFDPAATPQSLRRYDSEPNWKLPPVASRYPRLSTDRETADKHSLEWVTPGHPLFEALRRHTVDKARDSLADGACFFSLEASAPARIDFYWAKIVDGLGDTVHERLFAVETDADGQAAMRDQSVLGNLTPASAPADLPEIAHASEPRAWLSEHALTPFLEEVRKERLAEIERVARHVDLSLTELIYREDQRIARLNEDAGRGLDGAAGNLRQAEIRHAELMERRERRRAELERQSSLTLQDVQRMTSVLVLPHPERDQPELRNLRPDPETEAIAMRVAIEHERAAGRQVSDVHERDLGYDVTSLDTNTGELRLIEVKGLAGDEGVVALTPNEKRTAEDRRDCYWLYVVTRCKRPDGPKLMTIKDPAQLDWDEIRKIDHYALSVTYLAPSY